MDIINIEFQTPFYLVLQLNLPLILLLIGLALAISRIVSFILRKPFKRSIDIDEVKLGIGDSSVTLRFDKRDQEIAYKIWVELVTRKIGMTFDVENDVIVEVYNSWYDFFRISRELLKNMPASKFKYSSDLIKLTISMLNEGLRPHLTKWQARFRHWYEVELQRNNTTSPQEIQQQYPEYASLVAELKSTNQKMLSYRDYLKKIAFRE